ncbi:MAG: DUF5615 family PIN-like protein, partial [Pyrinomonadaceae bacterium]
MLQLLSDEDFNNRILRGLRRRLPTLDIVRVQEVGLLTHSDPEVLEWAAQEGRVLLTHDVATMIKYAYNRITDGLPMPGVIAISQYLQISVAIDELEILANCSLEGEWQGQVVH